MAASPSDGRIRFGVFDFDPATRELRREGNPVRLQPQPAQVLALLLAKPGEIVSREELREALWGNDTFVDFDRGLNFCIAQIRSALRDSAESPLYVKTLPKRGYQFIAPMAARVQAAASPPSWKPLAIFAILGFLAVAALALIYFSRSNPVRIAVARFDNQTGGPDFERFTDALTDAVVGELSAAGDKKYAVIGNATILRVPREKRDLLAIHAALNAELVLLGEVQRSADGIHVFAQLIGLPDQAHLKVTRIVSTEAEPLKAQADLAKRILQNLSPRLTRRAKP